jgi:DUF1009 family protein
MGLRLGLIAGSGRLPFEIVEAAGERGLTVALVALEGNTDPEIERLAGGPCVWIAPGELGRLIDFLKEAGVEEVVLAGAVAKAELLRSTERLRPDARALALLGRLATRGDDALLRAVAEEIESEGIRVASSTAHLAGRITEEGPLVPGIDAPERAEDFALGLRVARALGAHDVGQTVVVKEGSVVAVEAVEGTDATIRRAGEVAGEGTVVVKVAKPGQDLRFDVPAIGPSTVALARDLGVAAIGLEAGRTILLDRRRTLRLALDSGIPIVGLGAGP